MEKLILFSIIACDIALYLFIKNLLPSYFNKKGENLATKEDIAEITKLQEEVQAQFHKELEEYSSDVHFKYDFYYRQYTGLYSKLYSIICQSEYVRRFFKLLKGLDLTVEEVPFVEISKRRTHDTIRMGQDQSYQHTEEKITDDITRFCKKEMCDFIIENGELATQDLLKLAVAYRFAYDNYSGNVTSGEAREVADSEEFILIREIVKSIIQEYNFLRKELKMPYIQSELDTGVFANIVLIE